MSTDKFTEWLKHPAFHLVILIVTFAYGFGALQSSLTEIKAQISELNSRREIYAEKFSSHDERIASLERAVFGK